MKASLLCALILVSLFLPLTALCAGGHGAGPSSKVGTLSDYFEPGTIQESEPLPIKQVIGLIIAGLASIVILLFVFSFLIGPGEKIREKVSESSDPFFTIVAILLIVLFLAIVQAYYDDILAWFSATMSSG